jgi:hypothetical protein
LLQIGDTLVSLDLIERFFLCDLTRCRGRCCVEGDAGAPLERSEFETLQKILPAVWNDLSEAARKVIERQGVGYIDREGDIVTSIVGGKDCVFTCYGADKTCRCAIEKAFHEKRIAFLKPVSCHLYPVRITRYRNFLAVNYQSWKVCQGAEALGRQQQMPLYRFLREPLTRRFGPSWYEQLDLCAREYLKQKP